MWVSVPSPASSISPSIHTPASLVISSTVLSLLPSVTVCVIGMNVAIHMPSSSIVKV